MNPKSFTASAEPAFLKPAQVARRFQVSPATITRLILDRKLNAVRVGRSYRVSQADIDEFTRRERTSPDPQPVTPKRPIVARSAILDAAWGKP